MEKRLVKILKTIGLCLGLFNVLAFFALRNCWSGMCKTLGYSAKKPDIFLLIPVGICVLYFAVFISELILVHVNKTGRKYPLVYTVVQGVFLAIVLVVVFCGGQKYVRFALPHFFKSLAIAAAIAFVYFLLVVYPKTSLRYSIAFKTSVIGLLIVTAVLVLTHFSICRLAYEPVVYAVEDEYQIVFSGSAKCLGSVNVGGKQYYDLNCGSERSSERVHKVCVPMNELDKAGKYTISVTPVIYRGPFGGYLGKTITKEYSFKAVDTTDGFKYLALSDIHARDKAAIKTGKASGDIDALFIDGDTLSMIDSFRDANFVNHICFEITKGSIPVIYARGNHECKGAYAEDLYKYVGSKDRKFYYGVRLGDVYVMVLDLGEDHDDEWWEFYGTAEFTEYRNEQVEFIKDEIKRGEFSERKYNVVMSHIPIVYVNARHDHEEIKKTLTELLNSVPVDMSLCAHQHYVMVFEPGLIKPYEMLTYNSAYSKGTYKGYLTDFNFPSLMVSKPGYTQSEGDESESSQIGLIVEADIASKTQKCTYINSRGEEIDVVNPFAEVTYGKQINFSIH